MTKTLSVPTIVAVAVCILMPALASAQVTLRNPLNTGTVINNLFDNNPTVGTKTIYNCTVSTVGSPDDNHKGVDFPVAVGTAVQAAGAGRVYQRDNTCNDVGSLSDMCGFGYGNHYRIDHAADTLDGNGLVSIYAHLQKNSVTIPVDSAVACGQQIGSSAASGQVTGAHLHFEVRTNGVSSATKIDPFIGSCSHTNPPNWTAVSSGQPTTQCDPRPLTPSNVTVTNATANSLRVNFKDNSINETAIRIERKIGTGSWTYYGYFNALSGASTWNWTNNGLSPGTNYCYRLYAETAGVSSTYYSNAACGTTL